MSEQTDAPDHVIFPTEAEAYVQELSPFAVTDIGSERWSVQRERLGQLNMQAVCNLREQKDDFVKEFLISHEKFPVLVHELLTVELWKERVFPLLLKTDVAPTSSFPAYLVLYHEGVVAGLLENALFSREACESAEECVLDLVDYCYRHLSQLMVKGEGGEGVREVEESESSDEEAKKSTLKELKDHHEHMAFVVSIKTVGILRGITDHLSALPLSVTTRILNTQDIPCLLVGLMEMRPWRKLGDKGQEMRFDEGEWSEVERADRLKLCKTEGQLWLTLYQLLMSPDCQQKYEINMHSKATILKLRAYLTEPLLEQVPVLGELQRYLEQLSFMDPPLSKRELILEQVPVIYEQLVRENSGKWKHIAKKHSKLLLQPTPAQLQAKAKRWVDAYNLDVLERLVEGPPKCAVCGREASKRCSRCRNEWYCGRECQVKQWKKHKPSCDVLAAAPPSSLAS